MEILIISIVFLVLLLLVVWRPYFNQAKNTGVEPAFAQQETSRKETNISLYQEHKAEIEKDFREGGIDEENYQYLLAELDQSLLQDIEASEKTLGELKNTSSDVHNSFGVIWPIALTVFILIFSAALYQYQGAYSAITQSQVQGEHESQQAQEDAQTEQTMNYLNELRKQVENNPDNGEAWYNIGQTLVSVGMFDAAINAYDQVIRIEGVDADLLGVKAQAYYYSNNQQMDEQVQGLIDKALVLDANDPATNILLGMHSFINQQYQSAIDAWQRVLSSNKVGVNTEALTEAVAEAKKRLELTSPEVNSSTQQVDKTQDSQPKGPQIKGPQIKVSVSLSAEVLEKLSQGEDKIVFIYAIPTNGQRMPLAAMKLKLSDLPVTVTLTDAQAMTPQSTLSSVSHVNVYAIVSDKGGAGIKAGDYKAQASNIDVLTKEIVALTVNTLVE